MYQYYNPNPVTAHAGDCVVRALCKALDREWASIYIGLCIEGLTLGEWGNANAVWDSYLRRLGWERHIIPNTCPDCYTVEQFAADNPRGVYILATGSHAVTVRNGVIYDTYDSGDKVPIYFFKRGD